MNLESQFNMKAKKVKINTIIDEEVFQITFTNSSLHIWKDSKVVLYDNRYIFVNTVDCFEGTLSKVEEDKTAEPFVKNLIYKNKITKLSAYPPGYLTDYAILINFDDLEWISLVDPVIINNIPAKLDRDKMINEKWDRKLKEYKPWEIISK